MKIPQAGDTVVVDIERIAPEGQGLGRVQGGGAVVFVPYTVPGDKVQALLLKSSSTFAQGRLTRLLASGPDRLEPACPVHFRADRPSTPFCGGCEWQQLSYEGQLRNKREMVLDCLRRIAKIPQPPVEPVLASPLPWGYRNKVQIPFAPAREPGGRPSAGFYGPGSRKVVDQDACPVQPELSVRISSAVKDLAAKLRWPIYDNETKRGWLRHLFIRTNSSGKALVALITKTPEFRREQEAEFVASLTAAFPEITSLYHNAQPDQSNVVVGQVWRKLWGAKGLEEKIGPYSFAASPGAFLQVNTGAAEILYAQALKFLKRAEAPWDLAVDLYCGVGTLTVWISKAATKVVGIEENREAVKDAWENAKRNKVQNARFIAARAEAGLPKLLGESDRSCAVLVDPPRAGLGTPVLRALTAHQVRRIVYVSCDPATFSRDAGYLLKSGFQLKTVQPVDLFPQTSHVELAALLDRP